MATLEELRAKAHELEIKELEDASEVAGVKAAYYSGLRGRAMPENATLQERRAYRAGNKRRVGGRERP